MIIAPAPPQEKERLKVLESYDILDTLAETDYDNIVRLATQICNTPISMISLVDSNRQWFKAKIGLDTPETSREIAFCSHAILQDEPVIIQDATQDERFKDNPLVKNDPNIRFYAGIPIKSPDGFNLGTLCVIDNVTRTLTEEQIFALRILSREIVNQLELRKHLKIQREMNELIHEKNQKLEALNKANNKLLSLIAHDMRSPLATLKATIDLTQEGIINQQEFASYIHVISKNLDAVNDLLNNLLEWAVLQFGGHEYTIEKIHLGTYIPAQLQPLLPQIQAKGNKLTLHVPADIQVNGNAHFIAFNLRNLISNANKFTDQGQIMCEASIDGDHVLIRVKDSGIGMSDAQVEQLFVWEKRQPGVGTRGEKGTGLGLVACYEMIERMHGRMDVKSELGKGTEFTLRLPAH